VTLAAVCAGEGRHSFVYDQQTVYSSQKYVWAEVHVVFRVVTSVLKLYFSTVMNDKTIKTHDFDRNCLFTPDHRPEFYGFLHKFYGSTACSSVRDIIFLNREMVPC